jgi:hypothetical protein
MLLSVEVFQQRKGAKIEVLLTSIQTLVPVAEARVDSQVTREVTAVGKARLV